MSATRRLAAILAADVVGYSRLIGQDEAGTLQTVKAIRSDIIDPVFAKYEGRIFKTTGDGLLGEFPSVVNAVACAVAIQRGIAERNTGFGKERQVKLRIGVNLGDVVIENGDVFGDGVNVAARLEGIASPGSLAISGTVKDHLGNKLELQFEDLGERVLKNIERPVRVYSLELDKTPVAKPELPLPDRPSIAVLPFQNMSGDPEQEYFADGMVEEIITALSRARWLFVIARNSTFSYKGRPIDVKQIGRELGVRYVLEGSVRKSANRVRITGQLIDASSGAHLWAERFDGGMEDVFDLQDQVTASVVGAIGPKVEQAELERSRRKPTDSLDAYDYYLRALAYVYLWTSADNAEAVKLLNRAIELDSGFAVAHGLLARCYAQRKAGGWTPINCSGDAAEAERLARRAIALGGDDAVALTTAGHTLAYVAGEVEAGTAAIDKALSLNPNLAWGWMFSAWARIWTSDFDDAIERVTRAMRLSPNDPQVFTMQSAMAAAHFGAERYHEALSWGEKALSQRDGMALALITATASAAFAGKFIKATSFQNRLRHVIPNFKLSGLRNHLPIRNTEDFNRWVEGLRKAGVPE